MYNARVARTAKKPMEQCDKCENFEWMYMMADFGSKRLCPLCVEHFEAAETLSNLSHSLPRASLSSSGSKRYYTTRYQQQNKRNNYLVFVPT